MRSVGRGSNNPGIRTRPRLGDTAYEERLERPVEDHLNWGMARVVGDWDRCWRGCKRRAMVDTGGTEGGGRKGQSISSLCAVCSVSTALYSFVCSFSSSTCREQPSAASAALMLPSTVSALPVGGQRARGNMTRRRVASSPSATRTFSSPSSHPPPLISSERTYLLVSNKHLPLVTRRRTQSYFVSEPPAYLRHIALQRAYALSFILCLLPLFLQD